MKQQVQETGVRKWFGDDFINLQSELLAAIESIVSDYGNCVLSGCTVTNNGNNTYTISDGVAYLKDSTGANGKICRVYSQTIAAASFPVYLQQATKDKDDVSTYGRAYQDAITKNIIVEYYAEIVTVQPGHSNYLSLTSAGVVTKLRDALQAASYRFVSDTEKTTWNAKLAAAAYTAADVLAKLLTVDGAGSGLDADKLDGVELSGLAQLSGAAFTGHVSSNTTIDSKTAAFTIDSTYNGKIIECSGTFNVTFSNALPAGFKCDIINIGSGTITLVGAGTLNSKSGHRKLASQYGGASAYCRATGVIVAVGDLTA
jgi:hypothetical protein